LLRNVGLLRTANEIDFIQEIMEIHIQHFPILYFLDDSDDGTGEIVRQYPQVVWSAKVPKPGDKWRCLEQAQQKAMDQILQDQGDGVWITNLFGDELLWYCPLQSIQRAEYMGWTATVWSPMHFFLHTSQQQTWETEWATKPVLERLRWYCPGTTQEGWPGAEVKQYKAFKGMIYTPGCKDYPEGAAQSTNPPPYPLYMHVGYRSPAQAMERVRGNLASGFNFDDRGMLKKGPFLDCLSGLGGPYKFRGDFSPFEILDLYQSMECKHE